MERYIEIRFAWERRDDWEQDRFDELFPRNENVSISGFFGRSWSNVVQIMMSGHGTSADLMFIAANCPHLKILDASHTDVSSEAISQLQQCRELEELDLSDTDCDDAAVEALNKLKRLSLLKVAETVVGNDGLADMHELVSLKGIDVRLTDVNAEGIDRWLQSRRLQVLSWTDPYYTIGSIRWSDGERSSRVPHLEYDFQVKLRPDGADSDQSTLIFRNGPDRNLSRQRMSFFPAPWRRSDGEYQFLLSVGEYEAEPVAMRNLSNHIEFRMPCTKAEALASAKE